MKRNLLIMCVLFFLPGFLFAGEPFKELQNLQGVKIYYKWGRTHLLKKDSPARLVLRVENTNPHAVNATFRVDYFYKAVIQSQADSIVHVCLKPGKKLTGRSYGLHFDTSNLSNEQVKSDDFLIELSEVKIEKVCGCNDFKTPIKE